MFNATLRKLTKYETLLREEMLKVLLSETADEIEKTVAPDRTAFTVFRRMELVVKLRDHYKLSYPAIGILLLRDHSTIINLYKKSKK